MTPSTDKARDVRHGAGPWGMMPPLRAGVLLAAGVVLLRGRSCLLGQHGQATPR